jgi:hypothetical protein
MIVYQLTEQQKNELVGQFFAPASMFNPIQDANGIWIITDQEVNGCTNPDFLWVQNLPTITYVPPVIPENRQQKVDAITAYMKSQLTDAEFRTFLSDSRTYLIDYTYYSDSLVYWVETTNNVDWGDFTLIGFKTKSYAGDLVDGVYPRAEYILSILIPMI